MSSVSSASTEQNTVHYALPVKTSANTSINSETNDRVPGIQYPTVSVDTSPRLHKPTISSPSIGYHRPVPYSVTQLQYENMKQRCKMLDQENQRLMRTQNDIVMDANRRVEMHVNEIRMLKTESKALAQTNKELRDLCCFLDDDRQKARRLAREWQKFGRYTSHVMRQEMYTYQQRQTELEGRCEQTARENEELRQLCLYLDEQRQGNLERAPDDESEDLGCGSSERSTDSENTKPEASQSGYNMQKENALRLLSEQLSSFPPPTGSSMADQSKETERMLDYIQSLEGRIRQLEITHNQDPFWTSASNVASDSDEKTIIDRWDEASTDDVTIQQTRGKHMQASTTSTMTSSGTTYGSSETDGESAVYVMGDELDVIGNLEVRTLNKIEEEKECEKEERLDDEGMPPPCAPLSASMLSVGRLSMTSESSDFSFCPSPFLELSRSASVSHSPAAKVTPSAPVASSRASSVDRSLSDAVRVLRLHERSQQNERAQTRDENAIVQHMCQVAWGALDQRSDISAV